MVTQADDNSLTKGLNIFDELYFKGMHPSLYFTPYAYAQALGNYGELPYEVGGSLAGFTTEGDNWGFGTQDRSSWWLTPSFENGAICTTIEKSKRDFDHDLTVFYAAYNPDLSPKTMLIAKLHPAHQIEKLDDTWGKRKYRFSMKARIDDIIPEGDPSDIVAVVRIYEQSWESGEYNFPQQFFKLIDQTNPSTLKAYSFNVRANQLNSNSYINIISPIFFYRSGGRTEFWVEITFNNTRSLYIDNICLFDQYYEKLFVIDNTPAIADIDTRMMDLLPTIQNYPNTYFDLYVDEPAPLMNRAYKLVSDRAVNKLNREINGAVIPFTRSELETMNHLRRPFDYLISDDYPFWYSTGITTKAVQDQLDYLICRDNYDISYNDKAGLRSFINLAQNFDDIASNDLRYIHTIQVSAEVYFEDDGTTIKSGLRAPTREEILVQGNLAMCYGAKGIMYYALWTTTDALSRCWGLLEDPTNTFQGYYDWNNIQNKNNPVAPNSRYWAVKELNEHIDKIAPELLQLTWKNGISLHKESLPPGYITYIAPIYTNDPNLTEMIEEKYIELGLFKKENTEHLEYFMIVNRRTQPDDSRTIKVYINKSGSSFTNWGIYELGSQNNWTINQIGYFIAGYPPGMGKLFRLGPVILSGGNITYNESISGTNTLTGNMVIKPGATLTITGTYFVNASITVEEGGSLYIEPGASLVFNENGSLTVNGRLVANGLPADKITFNFIDPLYGNGILIKDYQLVSVTNCVIKNADAGIQIIGSPSTTTLIKWNEFEGCNTAVSAVFSTSVLIQGNTIHNCRMGIFASQSVNLNIVLNNITSEYYSLPGIFLNSSSANIRSNWITGHSFGINLGNSSPVLGTNSLYNNYYYGIYSGSGSVPDLTLKISSVSCTNPPLYYPVGGANYIYENGGMYNEPLGNGAEIYLNNSGIALNGGANSITDDRNENNPPFFTKNLMDGTSMNDVVIPAAGNLWGDHPVYPLSERFGGLDVIYEPEGGLQMPDLRECEIVMYTTDGIPIDTLYPVAEAELTGEMEQLYAQAEEEMMEGNYEEAETIYRLIIQNYSELRTSFPAFVRLMAIERITDNDPDVYAAMSDFYLTFLNTVSDTLLQKMLRQLANICLVYSEEFEHAVVRFQEIIQENPGSEEALLAEIDLYTTQLLMESGWLQKGNASQVNAANFNSKITNLIKQKFGGKAETTAIDDIPAEYNLFQNYPNPFNPVTRITYHLPEDGKVSLKVYDILGREVKTLVNEFKSMGKHYAEFNASHLSSGVYIYRLEVDSKTFTKKLLLMK